MRAGLLSAAPGGHSPAAWQGGLGPDTRRQLLQPASAGLYVTGISFAAGDGARCPAGWVQQWANLNQEAGGAPIYTCISYGAAPPFVTGLSLTLPGAQCPAGSTAVAQDLDAGASASPGPVRACVTSSTSAAAALTSVSVVFGRRVAAATQPTCPAGAALVPGNANAGAADLAVRFCASAQLHATYAVAAGEVAASTSYMIHALADSWRSCLTLAGGMDMTRAPRYARGARVVSFPCDFPQTVDGQWVLQHQGSGRWVRQAQLCAGSASGQRLAARGTSTHTREQYLGTCLPAALAP
jgi:hypothetical protein